MSIIKATCCGRRVDIGSTHQVEHNYYWCNACYYSLYKRLKRELREVGSDHDINNPLQPMRKQKKWADRKRTKK